MSTHKCRTLDSALALTRKAYPDALYRWVDSVGRPQSISQVNHILAGPGRPRVIAETLTVEGAAGYVELTIY